MKRLNISKMFAWETKVSFSLNIYQSHLFLFKGVREKHTMKESIADGLGYMYLNLRQNNTAMLTYWSRNPCTALLPYCVWYWRWAVCSVAGWRQQAPSNQSCSARQFSGDFMSSWSSVIFARTLSTSLQHTLFSTSGCSTQCPRVQYTCRPKQKNKDW